MMDVALAVGSSVLSAFLQVLFDRMAKPDFLDLFRKQKFDVSILEKLKWKLLILQAVLEDAENKQTKNAAVKMWLDQLQDLFYEADDLLDQINTEALRIKVETQYPTSNQVSASADSSTFSVQFLKEMMPKLEVIVHKLDDFEQKIGILGLVKEAEPKKQQFRRPSTSLVENDECGRDDDKSKIIQHLFSVHGNTGNVTVVSIVGLGGIGKTTLAKLVYNDEGMNKHFDTKAWVCISEEYDAVRVTKSLLNELKISFSDSMESFNSLQLKLKEGLFKKRFLLVLDDLWNRDYNDWLALSAPFDGGKEGSKIIVTTRDEKIARMMCNNQHIHHLKPMSEEDCWSLFKKHALNNRGDTENLEFELTGREIVKKCRGLPLAVKATAGVLRSKETIEEWNEILTSDEWEQTNNQTGILPSLRLSYNHLSSHLKRCFGYCAVFHKAYQFSKNEVILLWMANDLLGSPQRNKRLEDVGDEFFRELRFRSLFQQSSDGKFSMHDLVNDLAKFSSGECFLRLEDCGQENGSLIVPRHFSYLVGEDDVFEKFKQLTQPKFLRTFLPIVFKEIVFLPRGKISKKFLMDTLPTSKSLRVLSLSGYSITHLPDSLSDLRQLRFLNLSSTRIQWLPIWICTFYNLQSLLLANCQHLKEFPKDMEKLVNLRYLDIRGVPLTKMPLKIERLKKIQFLSSFVVAKNDGSGIRELGKLCNLHGEFTMLGLENIANGETASMAKMKDKKCIQKLTLHWNGDSEDSRLVRDVLENLQPHTNIEHLRIDGYCGTRFPDWLQDSSFCHMTILHISNCKNCFCLPAIGQLPSLKILTIRGLSKVLEMGQEIYESSRKPFPCLAELCIEDCPELTGEIPKQLPLLRKLSISGCLGFVNSDGELTIFDSQADFSSLRQLIIKSMPNLKELSSSKLDLNKLLPCLEELRIVFCDNIVSSSINGLPTTLKELHIDSCRNFELETCHMPVESLYISGANCSIKNLRVSQIHTLQHLSLLSVWNMEELSIPQEDQNLTSLQYLSINECFDFVSFPVGGLPAPYLTDIYLASCFKLKSLPERMHTFLPSLRNLTIHNCPEIDCFPEGGLPSSLKSLVISNCRRLWSCHGEWGLHRLSSLTDFTLEGIDEQETWPPKGFLLPSTLMSLSLERYQNMKTINYGALQHLTCLQSLTIWYCPELQFNNGVFQHFTCLQSLSISRCPKIQFIDGLLQHLSSLQSLKIRDCPKLQFNNGVLHHLSCLRSLSIFGCTELRSLPEEGLPASLSQLVICGCPLLKQRLEVEKGEDWPKVAHIPFINVDEELIP